MRFASFSLALAATPLVMMAAATAGAQGFGFGSGSASYQLGRIKTDSIGFGYTVDDLNRRTLAQGVARAPVTGVPSVDRSAGRPLSSGPVQRPFSNINRRPTVSPYLQLFNSDNSFDPNFSTDYQTLVRPQLEQRQFNNQVRREAAQLNAQLQAIAAQPAFRPTGNQNLAPTGIGASVYSYTSHFYPRRR